MHNTCKCHNECSLDQGWLECAASNCNTAQQDTAVGEDYTLLAEHIHLQLLVWSELPSSRFVIDPVLTIKFMKTFHTVCAVCHFGAAHSH